LEQIRVCRYMYLQIIYNFCYGSALLGLIHFWKGTRDLLVPYKPVLKFVTVKGVVFITFWQGLIISLLMLDRPKEYASALQTWLLCVEMIVAAILTWLAFPAGPYIQAASGRQHAEGQRVDMLRAVQNVGDVVMLTDVVTDLKHQVCPASQSLHAICTIQAIVILSSEINLFLDCSVTIRGPSGSTC
jgi:hypothetical protein